MKMQTLSRVFTVAVGVLALSIPAIAAIKTAPNMKAPVGKVSAVPRAWAAVTITGKIIDVYPAQHLVVVEGQGNVPFDVRVTRSTKIESGTRELRLDNLNSEINKNASVRIVPERSGDIAQSIQFKG